MKIWMHDMLYSPRIGFVSDKRGKLFPHDTSMWPFPRPSLGYYPITCLAKSRKFTVIDKSGDKDITVSDICVSLSL
jgi:hypothetical protein